MEKIYPHTQFPSSEPFPLKEYFTSYAKSVNLDEELEVQSRTYKDNPIFDWFGIQLPEEKKKEIEEICSIDNLKTEDSHEPEDFKDHKTEAYITLDYLIDITDKARKFEVVRVREEAQKALDFLLYRTLCGKECGDEIARPTNSEKPPDLALGSDFVLSVRVYRPFIFTFEKKNLSNKLKLSHEIQILGSNKLTELRDTIVCNTDVGLCKESHTPVVEVDVDEAKMRYPSNFFFIENVFYNDMRSPDAIDYSEVIRNWAKEKGIKGLKTASMENVLISDLKPRLGYPYVYQHQGNCEHIIVFSDAHLLSRNDPLCTSDYPCLCKLRRKRSMLCNICGLVNARWICAHSNRLPHEYCCMCHECFVSYNFINDEKVGKFKAYPLLDKVLK